VQAGAGVGAVVGDVEEGQFHDRSFYQDSSGDSLIVTISVYGTSSM
jgi:hypothetical protein